MLTVYRKIEELFQPESPPKDCTCITGGHRCYLKPMGSLQRGTPSVKDRIRDNVGPRPLQAFRDVSIEYSTKLYAPRNVIFDEYSGESQVSLYTMDRGGGDATSKGSLKEIGLRG